MSYSIKSKMVAFFIALLAVLAVLVGSPSTTEAKMRHDATTTSVAILKSRHVVPTE